MHRYPLNREPVQQMLAQKLKSPVLSRETRPLDFGSITCFKQQPNQIIWYLYTQLWVPLTQVTPMLTPPSLRAKNSGMRLNEALESRQFKYLLLTGTLRRALLQAMPCKASGWQRRWPFSPSHLPTSLSSPSTPVHSLGLRCQRHERRWCPTQPQGRALWPLA